MLHYFSVLVLWDSFRERCTFLPSRKMPLPISYRNALSLRCPVKEINCKLYIIGDVSSFLLFTSEFLALPETSPVSLADDFLVGSWTWEQIPSSLVMWKCSVLSGSWGPEQSVMESGWTFVPNDSWECVVAVLRIHRIPAITIGKWFVLIGISSA